MVRTTAFTAEGAPGFFAATLKPVLFSMVVTALALCVLALFIAYGSVSEDAADTCILAATVLSVFVAGFSASRRRRKRGMVTGMATGVLYVVLAYILGALLFDSFSVGTDTFKMLLICIGAGAVGGIIGINTRK